VGSDYYGTGPETNGRADGFANFDIVAEAEQLTAWGAEDVACCVCGKNLGGRPVWAGGILNFHCGACARERAA
jgi:hypothetical protein